MHSTIHSGSSNSGNLPASAATAAPTMGIGGGGSGGLVICGPQGSTGLGGGEMNEIFMRRVRMVRAIMIDDRRIPFAILYVKANLPLAQINEVMEYLLNEGQVVQTENNNYHLIDRTLTDKVDDS